MRESEVKISGSCPSDSLLTNYKIDKSHNLFSGAAHEYLQLINLAVTAAFYTIDVKPSLLVPSSGLKGPD
jgi:hypothetical protein